MREWIAIFMLLFIVLALLLQPAHAAEGDVQGAKDDPLIERPTGAVIKRYRAYAYDEGKFPVANIERRTDITDGMRAVSGKLTQLWYELPPEVSAFHAYQSYRSALAARGFEIVLDCRDINADCGRAFEDSMAAPAGPRHPDFDTIGMQYGGPAITARGQQGGREAWVFAYFNPQRRTDVYQQTVIATSLEPLVSVNALASLPAPPSVKAAQPSKPDVPGSSDDPLITRPSGAHIWRYRSSPFDQTRVPVGPVDTAADLAANMKTVPGAFTQIAYQLPAGVSAFHAYQSYRDALQGQGFRIVLDCRDIDTDCGRLFVDSMAAPSGPRHRDFDTVGMQYGGPALTANKQEGGRDVWVFAYFNPQRETDIFQQVVVAGAGEQLVEIKQPDAIERELEANGAATIGGIYFDTDKAVVKPESRPAIEQIAALLKANATLKLYVVGHTDDTGNFAHNTTLSRQRAAAVADYLVREFGIAATRLQGEGAGPLAPVASNIDPAGRALNRRVVIVVRLER